MSPLVRNFSRLWVIVPILAGGFVIWSGHSRVARIAYVSGLAVPARTLDAVDAKSETGRARGWRELIVPQDDERSFEWIAQTQRMFARGEWRVRHIDSDNAPFGRDVHSGSPYRWWIGFLAWIDHVLSGRPLGLSVERAALWSGPILHLCLIGAAAVFAGWRFGGFAAAVLSLGAAATYPFASLFVPGALDEKGFALAFALAGILLLVAGVNDFPSPQSPESVPCARRRRMRCFVGAGIAGGLGMWVDVSVGMPIAAGIVLGALAAGAIVGRKASGVPTGLPLPALFRAWAFAGGATALAAYLAEFFPNHLRSGWLGSVHPLYGIAWIGTGELLARTLGWLQGERSSWNMRNLALVTLSAGAVGALPVAMAMAASRGVPIFDHTWAGLSPLLSGPVGESLPKWLGREGASPTAWATLLPLLAIPAAGLTLVCRATLESRAAIAVAFGPVLVALGLACLRLGWWNALDGTLLILFVAAIVAPGIPARASFLGFVGAVACAWAIPGITRLLPPAPAGAGTILTSAEAEGVIERNLAHWLAARAGEAGSVVYAPPHTTAALSYYGGLRGIGTFSGENRSGFGAGLMIAGANTMEEAQALLEARGARYVIIPSWDPFFDDFARLYLTKGLSKRTSVLISELRRWNPPLWLHPVPYQLPAIRGLEGQSVLVFELVDEQTPVLAYSRLAEYLVEVGQLDRAAAIALALQRNPGDLGALAARAQVDGVRGDSAGFAEILRAVLTRLSGKADRYLPWDRRVSLVIVLAQGEQAEAAREQALLCLAGLNEEGLRSLSTGSLYNLLVVSHAFGLTIDDPRLRELALDLLPDDLRSRL